MAFGTYAAHGKVIKTYRNARMQYDPGEIVGTRRIAAPGLNPWSICTSHVERGNLTIRTFMRRFTRLALGFSRKLENLEAACALHVAYFNFCWTPGKLDTTPAVAAGVAERPWLFDELLAA